jgi:hypothetical protein
MASLMSKELILIIVLLVVFIVALLLLRKFRKSRFHEEEEEEAHIQARIMDVTDARYEPGERAAALVSEQIEEMVKQKLAGYPDLNKLKIDFGTAPDGSLEIWVGETKYNSVDAIADSRIRDAVKASVDSFNQ